MVVLQFNLIGLLSTDKINNFYCTELMILFQCAIIN